MLKKKAVDKGFSNKSKELINLIQNKKWKIDAIFYLFIKNNYKNIREFFEEINNLKIFDFELEYFIYKYNEKKLTKYYNNIFVKQSKIKNYYIINTLEYLKIYDLKSILKYFNIYENKDKNPLEEIEENKINSIKKMLNYDMPIEKIAQIIVVDMEIIKYLKAKDDKTRTD